MADLMENATPELIFEQFRSRRAGIEQALTTDMEKFIKECDSAKDSLCLYGLPDESWQVRLPAEMVPHSLPVPAIGINLVRNGMERYAWLTMVADHSDSWLLAVAFYYASHSHFDKESREKLFNMINSLPTVKEIVTRHNTANKKSTQGKNIRVEGGEEEKRRALEACGSGSSFTTKMSQGRGTGEGRGDAGVGLERGQDPVEEEKDAKCKFCEESETPGEFWIFCDGCQSWYHGDCV